MSTLFLSVWMGFLAVSAAARPQETAPQGGAAEPDRRPYRTVLKDDVFTLRFDLPNHQPSPVVDVMINDQGPYRFIVDTGAGACVIDTELAAELELPVIDSSEIGDPSGNERITSDVFEIEVLSLGDFRAEGLPIVGLDRRTFGGTTHGVLGLPLFHDHLLTIDFPNGVLHVTDGRLQADAEHVVDYQAEDGRLPQVEFSIGTRTVSTTVDTGSPDTFTLQASTIDGLTWLEPLAVVGRARTVNSSFDIRRGRVQGTFELAGHRFENPFVSVNELFPHANLGYEVLGDFALSIDQRGRRMRFQRGGLSDPRQDLVATKAKAD